MDSIVNRSRIWLMACIVAVGVGSSMAQTEMPTVEVAEHPDHGPHLVDGEGMSLYLFTRDEEGPSQCTGDCAEAWPPVLVEGQVAFGDGVELGLLGTVAREDGTQQLTYAGRPLYAFAQDQEPGDVAGHGANDAWFLVDPTGGAIGAAATPETDAAADEDDTDTSAGEGDGASDDAGTASDEAAEADAASDDADATSGEAEAEGDAEADADGEGDMAAHLDEGADVYAAECAQCHGRNGSESAGGAAVLAGNDNLANGPRVARQILFGSQYMPAFADRLTDHEVAAVGTYIRNSWGNDFGVLPEEEVVQERARFD